MPIYVPDSSGDLTAINQAVAQATTDLPTGDIGAAFAKMCFALVILVALLVISYWFLKRFVYHRIQKNGENAAIQVLEKRMLSPKTMLYLIEVNQKKILVAESQLEIKRLSEETPQQNGR